MSASDLNLYERLIDAVDDRVRARIIAEAIGQLEDRFPLLKEVATQPQLRETELRLQKEIKKVESYLIKEIPAVDLKMTNATKIAEVQPVHWVIGVALLQTIFLTGLILKLTHHI